MSKTIPTTEQLVNNFLTTLTNEIRSKIDSTITTEQIKSVLRAVATADAAVLKILYYYSRDVRKNILPTTADSRETSTIGSLEDWGYLKLRRYPRKATSGYYNCRFTGNPSATLDAGAQIINNETDQVYILQAGLTLSLSGSGSGIVKAATAGNVAKLNSGDILQTQSPFTGINEDVLILAETTAPVDDENIEDYRKLVIDAFRNNPGGGSAGDYRAWGKDATGVQEIFPYVSDNPNIIFLFVKALPGYYDSNYVVYDSVLREVEEYCILDPDTTLEKRERERAPLEAKIQAYSAIYKVINITITGLTSDTPEIRSGIETAVSEYLDSLQPYLDTIDNESNRNDVIDAVQIKAVIKSTLPAGVSITSIVVYDGTNEIDYVDLSALQGTLSRIGVLTYA